MAAESCLKRDMEDDFDDSDDEMPLSFRKSAQSSRPSQVNQEVKKSSSQPQRRLICILSSPNPQKGKVAPPAKPSSMRSPVVNTKTEKEGTSVLSGKVLPMVNFKPQKQGTSVVSRKVSPMRSSVPNSKASTRVASTSVKVKVESLKRPRQSNSDDDLPLFTKIKVNSKWSPPPLQPKISVKKSPDASDDEDSFDDLPLFYKVNSKWSPPPPQPKTSVTKSPDDSDDENPLKSKYPLSSSAGSSTHRELSPRIVMISKPLATKLQQNGSAGRDNQGKSSTVLSKVYIDRRNNFGGSDRANSYTQETNSANDLAGEDGVDASTQETTSGNDSAGVNVTNACTKETAKELWNTHRKHISEENTEQCKDIFLCTNEDVPSLRSSLDFKNVKNIDDFNIVINGLNIDAVVSDQVKTEYYDLCYSQKSYLHDNILKDVKDSKWAASIISQIVNIANVSRACKLSTPLSDYTSWNKILYSFEVLGMNVEFLRARLRRLGRLSADSKEDDMLRTQIVEARQELVDTEKKILTLETEVSKLKEKKEELVAGMEATMAVLDKREGQFQEEVVAPW